MGPMHILEATANSSHAGSCLGALPLLEWWVTVSLGTKGIRVCIPYLTSKMPPWSSLCGLGEPTLVTRMSKLSLAVTQLLHHRLICLLAGNTERELESFLSIPTEVTFPPDHTAHLGHGGPRPSGVFIHEHHNSCVKGADRRGAPEYHWYGQDRAVGSQHLELPDKEVQFFWQTIQAKQPGYKSPGQALSSQSLRNDIALGCLHTLQVSGVKLRLPWRRVTSRPSKRVLWLPWCLLSLAACTRDALS